MIFAFGGCALFATSYHVVQRTCQVRLYSDKLAAFTFWGWQAVIVAAVITLPLGYTSSKEYAELEWPIDILITSWVAFAIVFFGTIVKRKTKHIYVANWFFGAYILTVALLHIVNSAEIPVTMWKSSPAACAGRDGAVVVRPQRGRLLPHCRLSGDDVLLHPKAGGTADLLVSPVGRALLGADLHLHVGRPTSLALHRTAGLGAVAWNGVFLILLAPSWGGMINGDDSVGAWHKLRTDPILKFLITALSFYGMSTFEGPMMSIKTVNALSHYTDWTIGHTPAH